MKKLKLMADYSAGFPLWGDDGQLSDQGFPVSKDLTEALIEWCAEVNQWIDWDDPTTFLATPFEMLKHDCKGIDLLIRLRNELGEGHELHFESWRLGKIANEVDFLLKLRGDIYLAAERSLD